MKIYLIGSMRNPKVPKLANELRVTGHEVVDDWFSSGPEADMFWREYELARGRDFQRALDGIHARHVFDVDKRWLDWAEIVVLVAPAGRSGHMELGYSIGRGKHGYILLEEPNPDRWDIMYRFASGVTADPDELKSWLDEY